MSEIDFEDNDGVDTATVTVAGRCNGPTESGNGGYSSGLFAALLDGPAAVSLRNPVPLDTELDVERSASGSVRVTDGELHVASIEPADALRLELPVAPSLEDAREASRHYRAGSGTLFSTCFVCGPDRDDALGVFAGSVPGRDLVASPWTPRPETADGPGAIREETIWAVLDCPTYFALYPDPEAGMPLAFLARMQAHVDAVPQVGEESVVVAWPIERDGRKLHAGSAIFAADGSPLAFARVLLIEARPEAGHAGGSA